MPFKHSLIWFFTIVKYSCFSSLTLSPIHKIGVIEEASADFNFLFISLLFSPNALLSECPQITACTPSSARKAGETSPV